MTHPNEPAFPRSTHDGLSKREEFAKTALQGILANSELANSISALTTTEKRGSQIVAESAVEHADALIEQLNKSEHAH